MWVIIPLLVVSGVSAFLMARLIGTVFFVALFVLLARSFGNRRLGRRWESRLAKIPIFEDVLREETDLAFATGTTRRIAIDAQGDR